MYLLITLFLIFQMENVDAKDLAKEEQNVNVEQTIENIELSQDNAAKEADRMLRQTKDPSLKEKIYKAFEKFFERTNAIIQKLHLRRN